MLYLQEPRVVMDANRAASSSRHSTTPIPEEETYSGH